jgi:alkylated DNA repair dioxygenase AlkB
MSNARSSPPLADAPAPWTPTLFDAEPVGFDAALTGLDHLDLADGAWVEHLPGWLRGAAAVFDDLATHVPWRSGRQLMYDHLVDTPRLYGAGRDAVAACALAGPVIDSMATALSRRYGVLLANVGLNYYRDGRDSVAWHGDRVARDRDAAVIAIVSVGGARPFRLRPRTGGPGHDWRLGGGDLLVMGGTCQRTWRHAVPKVASGAPPRISISFRHDY